MSEGVDKTMADIFLSYAREDEERAKTLAEVLARQGWSVWWDRKIPTGRRFDDVIAEELAIARCVIVLWSINGVSSSWVREEAADARDRNVLAPVLVEAALPPIGFRGIQTADLTMWQGDERHPGFRQLLADIRNSLDVPRPPASSESRAARERGGPDETEQKRARTEPRERGADRTKPTGGPQVPPPRPAFHFHMQKWIMLGIAAGALIFVGFMLWLMWVFGGTSLIENLIAPQSYEGEFAEESLKNLQYGLGRIGLEFWAVGAFTGLIWLVRSSFANVVSPAHVGRLRGFWWRCFVVGGLVALGAAYTGLFGSLPDLRRELWVMVPVAMLPLYLMSFWLIGSWLFTRAAVRRAVPGANSFPI